MVKISVDNQRGDDQRNAMYFCGVGICGLVLVIVWFLTIVVKADVGRVGLGGIVVLWASVFVLCVIALVSFYVAYGFKVGRLDAVTGSMASAVLIQDGKPVLQGYPIRFKRIYNWEDRSIPDEEREFLFTCHWRPWVCKTRTFLLSPCDE